MICLLFTRLILSIPTHFTLHSPEDGSKGESIVADMYDGWLFYKEKGASVDVHSGRNWEKRKVVLHPKGE